MEKVILFVKADFKIGNPGYVPTIVVDKHGKRTTVYKLAGDREPSRHVEKRDIDALYQHAINHPLSAPDSVRLVLGDQLKAVFEKGPAVLSKDGDILVRGGAVAAVHGTKRGYGMVKIIWKHGEKSPKAGTSTQVTKADILRLPHLLRDIEPEASPGQLRWNIQRHDGEVVCYAISTFTGDAGPMHVVTIHVDEAKKKP